MNNKLKPTTKEELEKMICDEFSIQGDLKIINLNNIDTSLITDMSELFRNYNKMIDISQWNVSNVKNMSGMFCFYNFLGDISNWDVSNVENMQEMFFLTVFNIDLSKWRPVNIINSSDMFGNIIGITPDWYSEDANQIRFNIKKIQTEELSIQLEHRLPPSETKRNQLKM